MSSESAKQEGQKMVREVMESAKPLDKNVLVKMEVAILDSQSITMVVQRQSSLSARTTNLMLLDTLGKLADAVIRVMEQDEGEESDAHKGIH